MPIRKFDRILDGRGLYTGKHEIIVECDQCGKQFTFETSHSFTDVNHPPEIEENGLVTILKPWTYDFICAEHLSTKENDNA